MRNAMQIVTRMHHAVTKLGSRASHHYVEPHLHGQLYPNKNLAHSKVGIYLPNKYGKGFMPT